MIDTKTYTDYFNMLISGDRLGCMELFKDLIDKGTDLKVLYKDLIQTSMYEVGYLWEQSKISVAVEHLCSAITATLLHHTYPIVFKTGIRHEKCIISCCYSEHHYLGAMIISDYLTYNGWDCRFLGASSPKEDLIKYIKAESPTFLGLSVSIIRDKRSLLSDISDIKSECPDINIVLGGRGLCDISNDDINGTFTPISSFEGLDNYIMNLSYGN